MNILETFQKSVWITTYLKKHPRGGAIGQGVSLDEIVRAIRLKRKNVYPVIDYLIEEGFIERPDESNDSLFKLTHKGLVR